MTIAELLRRLRLLIVLRGVAALALGIGLLALPAATASAVVTAVATYWVADGLVVLWAAGIARSHGFGGWRLLARGIVPVLVGLWALGSPVTDVLGEGYWFGAFSASLVLIPALLLLVTFQGVLAAVTDVLAWRFFRRELAGDVTGLVSAGLAVGTAILLWRAILGFADRYVAAILAVLAGVALLLCALRLWTSRASPSAG